MNKKELIHKAVINCFVILAIGIVTSLLSIFILQLFQFRLDFDKTFAFIDAQTRLNVLQAGIIFVIYLWLVAFSGSKIFSSFLLLIFSLVIGVANQQKLIFRGEPVFPSDIFFVKNALFLLEMVETKIVLSVIAVLIAFVVGLILFFRKKWKNHSHSSFKVTFVRIISFSVMSLLLLYVYHFNRPGNMVRAAFDSHVTWVDHSQDKNYSQNGVVAGLMFNLKSPAVERPKDYSKERVKEIYEKYRQEAEQINKVRSDELDNYNVIYVMSESYSDPSRLSGITLSEDPMPQFRKLTAINCNGQSFSQGYGGGTANIEFEALTGVSMEPLSANITTPFIQLSNQMKDLPVVVDIMKNTNHYSAAVHPYNSTLYKRLDNYEKFGFDSFKFQDEMNHTDTIDHNALISDQSAFNEVWDILEQSNDKLFIHLVTMQNHKSYLGKYEDITMKVEGAANNAEIEHYATGIQHSDQAFYDFLSQLDQFEEKTMVVFWGDHLPGIYESDIYELNGHMTMHETPLMFYTNYSDDNKNIGTISPIYFISHVLEKANAKVSPFVALLQKLEENLPAFEKGYYLEEGTGIHHSREELQDETLEILKEYDLILYDLMVGKNYSRELGFY